MKKWVVGGSAVGVAAVWACLTLHKADVPAPPAAPEPAVTVQAPPEPAAPAAVVDVTDIDALLDPPAEVAPAVTPVSFEEAVPPTTSPASAVVPIPPAAE